MDSLKNLWNIYRHTILRNCTDTNVDPASSEYWQNKLFAWSILYIIPLCFVAVIPSIYMAYVEDIKGLFLVDFITIVIIIFLGFLPKISVFSRKIIFNGILYIANSIFLIYLGFHGPAILYLFGITVFVVLSMDKLYGYISVVLNAFTCFIIGYLIYSERYGFEVIHEYELGSWIAVSSNLIFLSAMAVLLIPILFENLQTALVKEEKHRSDLENEQHWLRLLESAIGNTSESIAIIEARPTGGTGRKILYVNDAFGNMTGYSRGEVIGKSFFFLNGPKTSIDERKHLSKALEEWRSYQSEFINYRKDGSEYWVHVSFAPVLNPEDEYSHWVVVGRDVTERKKREDDLKESLQEKETLLMEIHHRVKNNLAVVSSMMQLQAMEEADKSLQQKLYDSVTRIRTMVTIHELLYQSRSFAKLDFAENLKNLISMVIDTFRGDQAITVNYHCENVHLNVNQAIPSSLIVNEVVTNAVKHAFKNKSEGIISIELSDSDNLVTIRILDNGIGIPEKFNTEDTSLGMRLIDILAQQMNADYKYTKSEYGGTVFEIEFEKSSVKGIGSAFLS